MLLDHIFWDVKDPPSSALRIWFDERECTGYYDVMREEDWNIQLLLHAEGFFKLKMITDTQTCNAKTVMMPVESNIKRIMEEIYRSYCATGTFLLEKFTLFGGLQWCNTTQTAHVVLKLAG
jgi:hypothetical protein